MSPDTTADSPLARVAHLLTERGWVLATAESCTGGLLGNVITDRPGSSAFYVGGVIAYSNQVKVDHLGVSPVDLAEFGAVSEPVARQMAEGVRERFSADVALSVTGVAGPGGGTKDKPVGTVWMAVRLPTQGFQSKKTFIGDRERIRSESVQFLLSALAEALVNYDRI